MSFRMLTMFAFVSVDADGDEGLVAERLGNTWIPFVAGDRERLERLRPRVIELARRTGRTIRLLRFDRRTDLDTIDPDREPSS